MSKLDTVEQWVRRAGGMVLLTPIGVAYHGLAQSVRRPQGRVAGWAPATLLRSLPFYVVAGVIFFGAIARLWRPLPLRLPTWARIAALVAGVPLYLGGIALYMAGRFALGEMYGGSTSLGAQLYADHRLVTNGPYAWVRHPMYLGAQLAALGSLLLYRTWATLLVAICFPWLRLRARREEEALAAEFGAAWTAYCRRVPSWIPRLRHVGPR